MEILIIAGPASVVLDRVRMLTNFSTGKTGVVLAETLRKHRHHVTLWYGSGATYPLPTGFHSSERFRTIQDLENLLHSTELHRFGAILLPAALPDYDFDSAQDLSGHPLSGEKWPGHLKGVRLAFKPASRVLHKIRRLAPPAKIIGWKWVAEGTPAELDALARDQIKASQSDGCVLNGPAYGEGYLFIPRQGESHHCPHSEELGNKLAFFLGPT